MIRLSETIRRCVRPGAGDAGQAVVGATLHCLQRLHLRQAPEQVMACLRDLGCLYRCWPRALGLKALPGGLHQAGDLGLLETEDGELLLRVVAFRRHRLVLALEAAQGLTLIDLRLRECRGDCELCVRLERPAPRWPLLEPWRARELARLARQFCARLQRLLEARAS